MQRFQDTESVEREILRLERQGLHLSGASLVVLLALAAVAMAAPVPSANSGLVRGLARGNLPWDVLCVFVLLAAVFGLYSFWRQRVLSHARGDQVRDLVRHDAMEKLTLLDPLTETFNRRHLEELIRREADRVERHGTSLTFLRIEVENLAELTTRSGGEVGERLLKDVAQLLKNSLRPTDVVVRYDTSEFLIVMSETSKHGALAAVRRLLERADELNRANEDVPGYPIRLSYGVAAHRKGIDVRDVLAAAGHSVKLYRERS